MPTKIAQVTVTRVEAGNGFLIACPTCGDRTIRTTRWAADIVAVNHQRSHVTPDPTDQVTALG